MIRVLESTTTEIRRPVLKLYVILYRFKLAGEKKPGPVRQFRIYADTLEEARSLTAQQANYPDIEVLSVRAAG